MADAPDSKSGTRKGVWVQLPPPAITNLATLDLSLGSKLKCLLFILPLWLT